jgi:signal transduction histidine kinase
MSKERVSGQFRIGLQLKSGVILALIVLGGTGAGGWFYLDAARESLRKSDRQYAAQLTTALGMAAQYDLHQGREVPLQRLVTDFLTNQAIRYASLVDARGQVVVSSCGDRSPKEWVRLCDLPVSVSSTRELGDDVLVLGRPIVMRDAVWFEDRLVGAVRVVFDTSATTSKLATVRKRMTAVAAGIVVCGIPLGCLLVWHVMILPLRKLVGVAGRLAKGEFAARCKLSRADEIGHLGTAFDSMAGDLASARDELLVANEQLERKVAERTEELQLANQRLRSEMAEKEEFLRAVSHDLNAPLRNVAGMAALVMMKWGSQLPEEVLARLQRIQANVDVETSMIGELLELSRIRSRPQRRQVVNLGELLGRLEETFEYELRNRGIHMEVAGPMPSLYIEPIRIRQAFQNLIDNAIKYMPAREGGWIRVGYRLAGRMHEFHVADNGPGIPADQLERVFCIFRRAESAATAGVPGKGVGLAVVRSVVSNYDGRAWVESELGRGSTFFVALGVDNTKPPPEEAPAGEDSEVVAEAQSPQKEEANVEY